MRPDGATNLKGVADHVGLDKNSVMLEIGCYTGESTMFWAERCKLVYAVDAWLTGYAPGKLISENDFDEVFRRYNERIKDQGNIATIRAKSVDASELFEPHSLDFVYIDGNHEYNAVMADIDAWVWAVKPGGFIGGHDYGSQYHVGVKKAVDEVFGQAKVARFPDHSWAVRV